MKVVVGSDLVTSATDGLLAHLADAGYELELVGPLAETDDEWANVGSMVGRRVASGEVDLGIVCCWTGTGVSIAANKVPGVRAALCGDSETARLARWYNHANVMALSLRASSEQIMKEASDAFLAGPLGSDDFDHRNVRHLDELDGVRPASL